MEFHQAGILFIYPPYIESNLVPEAILPPLGLGYIACYLKERGIDSQLVDFTGLRLKLDAITDILNCVKPKIVGLSAQTSSIAKAHIMAKIVKEYDSDILVLIGGSHSSALPDETLKKMNYFDIAVIGEGEETCLEIVNSYFSNRDYGNIKGIAYRDNRKIIINKRNEAIENLDLIPFPDRSLFGPIRNYRANIIYEAPPPMATMICSRGCPFQCTFCSKSVFGTEMRFRSPKNVVEEIEYLKKDFGVRSIIFYDDTFTMKKEFFNELCSILIRRNFGIKFNCLTRADAVTEDIAKKLRRANFCTIGIGVESGSEEILPKYKKEIKLNEIRKAFRLLNSEGLNTFANFIAGHPDETVRTLKESAEFAKEINPMFFSFCMLTPFPGTKIMEEVVDKKILRDTSYEQYCTDFPSKRLPIRLKNLTHREIDGQIKKAYKDFYFRIQKIFQILLFILKSPYKYSLVLVTILAYIRYNLFDMSDEKD